MLTPLSNEIGGRFHSKIAFNCGYAVINVHDRNQPKTYYAEFIEANRNAFFDLACLVVVFV